MKEYRFLMGALIPGKNRDGKPFDFKAGDVVEEKQIPAAYVRGWLQSGIIAEVTVVDPHGEVKPG